MYLRYSLIPLGICAALAGCPAPASPIDTTPTTTAPTTSTPIPTKPGDYAARGELAVGHSVHSVARDGSDELIVKAWYPADAEGLGEIDYLVSLQLLGFPSDPMPFFGAAHLDAEPLPGPFPLVVLSHGFSGNPEWYLDLAEHLASRGFVVLAPEHVELDWQLDVVAASATRPLDVSDTLDFAADGPLATVTDTERVAVVGHSYGGYTALAAAGARIDTGALARRCETVTDPFIGAFFCDPFLAGEADLADALGLDDVPTGLWPSLEDDRVDAIVPIAGDAYLFGDEGLASVRVPALMIGGTADTGTPWTWGADQAFDGVGSTWRGLVGLEGGEHMLPITHCDNMPWTAALPKGYADLFCADPAWDKDAAHAVIHHVTTAFLRQELSDDAAAAAALDPAELDAPELHVVVARSN
ncbi:MAG: hypothetical protein KTR31_12635 [Myxococcales bacterium]|nr:hypothetical protein [Myxococcales bacterium]